MSQLQSKLNYDLKELDQKQKDKFDEISKYFEEYTAQKIENHFEKASQIKIKMAEFIIDICCNVICHLNCQVHIINPSFRKCLLNYFKWRTHTQSNDQSLCMKMDDNCSILSHQIIQIQKFFEESDTEWNNKLLKELKEIGWRTEFLDFFLSMF